MIERHARLQEVKRVIDDTDPLVTKRHEYQTYKATPGRESFIFGHDLKASLAEIRTLPEYDYHIMHDHYLNRLRNELVTAYRRNKRGHVHNLLVNQVVQNPSDELLQALHPFIPDNLMSTDLFNPSKVSNEALEIIINQHVAQMESREQQLLEVVPELASLFEQKFEAAIQEGRIPTTADKNLRRKQRVNVRLNDPLHPESNFVSYHSPNTELVALAFPENVSQDTLFSHYTHEMMHVISAKSLGAVYTELVEDDRSLVTPGSMRLEQLKSGLRIIRNGRFTWLNEAITTELEGEVTDQQATVYPTERALFQSILNGSKDPAALRMLFFEAYFEDATVAMKGRNPAISALQDSLRGTYGVGFLQRLDRVVSDPHGGLATAISIMRNDPSQLGGIRLHPVFNKTEAEISR